MTARPHGDDGAAAVELGLVVPALLAVLTLVVPLALLLHAQTALGSTAGETVRFATSRTETVRTVGDPVSGTRVLRGALPTESQATDEARRAFTDRALLPVPSLTAATTATASTVCPSGTSRTVRLTAEISLGPAALLLGGSTTKTLRASATSCEE